MRKGKARIGTGEGWIDLECRHCQGNDNQSALPDADWISRRQLTQLGQRGGTVVVEVLAAVQVTFVIEMVVNGGWIAANFCSDFALLNFAIALSRRLNG